MRHEDGASFTKEVAQKFNKLQAVDGDLARMEEDNFYDNLYYDEYDQFGNDEASWSEGFQEGYQAAMQRMFGW